MNASSRIVGFFRDTWKLNLGGQSTTQFVRTGDSERTDATTNRDLRFEMLDEMIQRAFSSGELAAHPILYREQKFIGYYQLNKDDIHAKLNSTEFFRGRNVYMIESLILKRIREKTNRELYTDLEKLVSSIDFAFLEHVLNGPTSIENPKLFFLTVLKCVFSCGYVRHREAGSISAVQHGFIRKYLDPLLQTGAVRDMATLVPSADSISTDDTINFTRMSMLMMPAAYLAVDGDDEAECRLSREDLRGAFAKIKAKFPRFPESVLKVGLVAALPFRKNAKVPVISQFCSIISKRCERYTPSRHRDRGATGADESWFSIAGKNADRYELSPKLLAGLHAIAKRKHW